MHKFIQNNLLIVANGSNSFSIKNHVSQSWGDPLVVIDDTIAFSVSRNSASKLLTYFYAIKKGLMGEWEIIKEHKQPINTDQYIAEQS